jgi:putative Holliday junction resolvase
MRTGVRLAVDVGSVRVGVAACDALGTLATPVAVLKRDARNQTDLDALAALVGERDAVEVVVGLPRGLSGKDGAAAAAARAYAADLGGRIHPIAVRLVDERLSTVSANRGLQSAGIKAKAARAMIDAAAAVVILQHALDTERATGLPPGEEVQR